MVNAALLKALIRRRVKISHLFKAVFLVNLLFWSVIFVRPEDRRLHLKIYAVGEGDAIFIRTPGQKKILIDGGPNEKIIRHLSRDLPFYDRTLDLLILTHPHADHLNGLLAVLRRYRVKKILFNRTDFAGAAFSELQRLVAEKKIPVWTGLNGDLVRFGDGSTLQVVWPPDEMALAALSGQDPNAGSLVLLLGFGAFDALLTGDAGKEIQLSWPLPAGRRIEVLKVPHQGAFSALNESFLDKVRPQLAVVSVGKNTFGHPDPRVLGAYAGRKIPLLRTDQNGTVEITSDGRQWNYQVYNDK